MLTFTHLLSMSPLPKFYASPSATVIVTYDCPTLFARLFQPQPPYYHSIILAQTARPAPLPLILQANRVLRFLIHCTLFRSLASFSVSISSFDITFRHLIPRHALTPAASLLIPVAFLPPSLPPRNSPHAPNTIRVSSLNLLCCPYPLYHTMTSFPTNFLWYEKQQH